MTAPADTPKGTLYLLPVALGDTDLHNVLPDINFTIVRQIRYFVVENIRSARRFLKNATAVST